MYDPLTGEGYTRERATAAWSASMERVHHERHAPLRWQLHGGLGGPSAGPYWVFWNFGTWTGRVTIWADGIHWTTYDYDSGRELHTGVTRSVYEAFQSVEQGRPVQRAA